MWRRSVSGALEVVHIAGEESLSMQLTRLVRLVCSVNLSSSESNGLFPEAVMTSLPEKPIANQGLRLVSPILKMVHNPGGDWNPGRGPQPKAYAKSIQITGWNSSAGWWLVAFHGVHGCSTLMFLSCMPSCPSLRCLRLGSVFLPPKCSHEIYCIHLKMYFWLNIGFLVGMLLVYYIGPFPN